MTVVRDLLLTRQVRYRFARDSYRQTHHLKSLDFRIEVGFLPETFIENTSVGANASKRRSALDLVEEGVPT